MRDLAELRDEIDHIDRQIVELFKERMGISEEIAEYKIESGKEVFDREREESKLASLEGLAGDEFCRRGIKDLFEQIMATSRKRQYQLLTERGIREEPELEEVGSLDFSGARVVFQGTEGAYSQIAMREYFGKGIAGRPVKTWRDAMDAIRDGSADYAVLPIENSSAGIVSENYDLLDEYGHCIIGEQVLRIDHDLLGAPGASLSDIREVYSHPQALMQCSRYLARHAEWQAHEWPNTAMAAQKVCGDKDPRKAAIASPMSAEIYGLSVLEEAIQDDKSNATRFVIVSGRRVFLSGAKKISVCFEIAHESGTLYRALSHFIYNGLNLAHIESRPVPGKTWEYRFFLDVEGSLKDDAVISALRGLRGEALRLRILGNY